MHMFCHQSYSELKHIPVDYSIRMLKAFVNGITKFIGFISNSSTSTQAKGPNVLRPALPPPP